MSSTTITTKTKIKTDTDNKDNPSMDSMGMDNKIQNQIKTHIKKNSEKTHSKYVYSRKDKFEYRCVCRDFWGKNWYSENKKERIKIALYKLNNHMCRKKDCEYCTVHIYK
jgi:hypothetical protein